MPKKRWWTYQVFNACLVGAVVYVVSGAYGEKLDRDSRRIVLEVDPAMIPENPADNLTPEDLRQIDCLARNNYFEAANQGRRGMEAVTQVVFHRMESGLYPDQACQVITQPRQFSWVSDGKSHIIRDKDAAKLAYDVALNMWLYRSKMVDETGGATSYHAYYVSPKWRNLQETVQIGAHKFFKHLGGKS